MTINITLLTPNDPATNGTWGTAVNANFTALKNGAEAAQTTADSALAAANAVAGVTDAAIAALVANTGSSTHGAVAAAGVQLGTSGHTTAAYSDHDHAGVYVTPSGLTTAVNAAVATAIAALNLAQVVVYNSTSHTWPTRPTTSNAVLWNSSKDIAAAQPSDMAVGDSWIRHPDAIALV